MISRSHRMSLFFSALLAAGSVFAAPRTFVASFGSDANTASNCSPTAPCRTFTTAQTVTDNNGEIVVLDSAGYGAITITKSLSIIAPDGVYAGVVASSGNGITINTAGVNVVLRGLNINGQGTSTGSGILFQDGTSLLVDRCIVSGFGNHAAVASSAGILIMKATATIANSLVRGNPRGGVVFRGTGTTPETLIRGLVVDSLLEKNGAAYGTAQDAGVAVESGAVVTVRNSVSSGNFRGFSVGGSTTAAGAALTIESSLATRNVVGLLTSTSGAIATAMRISNSAVTDNTLFGIEQQGGTVVTSLGNNLVYNNAGGETFGLTTTPK